MQIFRTHTIKCAIVGLLTVSLLPFLFQKNGNLSSEDKLASWLQTFLLENGNREVAEKLHTLSASESGTAAYLKQASRIISDHSDYFSLPVSSEGNNDEEIFQLLLHEWAEYQHGSDMSSAVFLDRSSHNGFNVEKYYKIHADATQDFSKIKYQITQSTRVLIPLIRHHILPLIGGTAIGAP